MKTRNRRGWWRTETGEKSMKTERAGQIRRKQNLHKIALSFVFTTVR